MTERSMPWDGTTTGDASVAPYDAGTEFATLMRGLAGGDSNLDSGGIQFAAFVSGSQGDLTPTTNGANTVRVAPGVAWVNGTWYQNDANFNVTIPTPSVSTRFDYIVLRKSWAAQTVRITRVAGTEGGGIPALTQIVGVTWDQPIVVVQITTGGVMTYIDARDLVGPAHPITQVVLSGSPVLITSANTFFTPLSIPTQHGIWLLFANVIVAATTASFITAKLTDSTGSNISGALANHTLAANGRATLSLFGLDLPGVAAGLTPWRLQVESDTTTASVVVGTQMTAFRSG